MATVVHDCFVSSAGGAGPTGLLPGDRQGPLSPWKAHLALGLLSIDPELPLLSLSPKAPA